MANPHQLEELKLKIVTKEEIEHRIQNKWPNQPFEIIQYTKVSQPFSIKCLKCGRIKNIVVLVISILLPKVESVFVNLEKIIFKKAFR